VCSLGVGLSLNSWWSISTAPVRAALTFFAAAKKVSKESGLTPLALKRVPWLGGGSGASGISAPAHSTFVTKQSCFPPRCAGRRGTSFQRKQAKSAVYTTSSYAGPLACRGPWCIWNRCSRTLRVRDKAVILPATLRGPAWYFFLPCCVPAGQVNWSGPKGCSSTLGSRYKTRSSLTAVRAVGALSSDFAY
jgi:hypothetical protein